MTERAVALRLARAVRARRVSAEELIGECARRIEATNPAINAVVSLRLEEAFREARELDRAIARGDRVGPLAGVPVLVKDVDDVQGLVTSHGSLLRAFDPPARMDGLVPSRLRAAGAILLGKTNVPEFAFEGYTDNRVFGPTRNPWSSQWSPGGSSGGSAAAVAAGMVPMATGTDAGGSIRCPAALCGLVGFKPSNGVIARWPTPALLDLATDGPIAATVADARAFLWATAGPGAGDPTAIPRLPEKAGEWCPKRLLATTRLCPGRDVESSVADLFDTVVSELARALRLEVQWIPPGSIFSTGNPDEDWGALCGVEQLRWLGVQRVEASWDQLDPRFREWMERSMGVSAQDYVLLRRRRFEYARDLDLLLGTDAILASPTLTVVGWPPDGRLPGAVEPGLPAQLFNTNAQNFGGHPAVSVPAGTTEAGVPFGLQLTSPRFYDEHLLDVAGLWEREHPWPLVAPGYDPFVA